ncbi:DNA-binding protein [Methyloceanibacter sp.]|uniref:DNA-binding protein n=1 Tax=Methyloceanibacter sp. TaxID=1965321 RepID=UPI00351ADCF4
MPDETNPLADDLLIGADPIAKFTGMDVRAVYHAAAKGHLPTFKVGQKIAARKSELNRRLSAAEAK